MSKADLKHTFHLVLKIGAVCHCMTRLRSCMPICKRCRSQ